MGACSDRPGGKVLEKDSPKNLLHDHKSVCVKFEQIFFLIMLVTVFFSGFTAWYMNPEPQAAIDVRHVLEIIIISRFSNN